MRRISLLGLALVAVLALTAFAVSAVVATAAEAIEAPFIKVEGTRLKKGEEKEVKGKQVAGTSYVLKAGAVTITCTAQKLKAGAKIIGSAVGEPGTSTETIEFSGCTVAGNGTGCNVSHGGTITTEPVKDELVYLSKETDKAKFIAEYIGTLFVPVTSTKFVKVEFEPKPPCEVLSTEVTGAVVGEAQSSTGAKVGPSGVEPEEEKGRVNFPATPILLYETVKASVGTVRELTTASTPTWLKAFGVKATLTGASELELAGKNWGVFTAECRSKGLPVWKIGGKVLCTGESKKEEGTQTKLEIHDSLGGEEYELECKELKFKQEFVGGEPGKANMTEQGLVEPCKVLKPEGCVAEKVKLNEVPQTWKGTLEKLSVIGFPPEEIWQHVPKEILELKYELSGEECPKKGKESSDEELQGNFGPFKPGPENGLSFSGEAVEVES